MPAGYPRRDRSPNGAGRDSFVGIADRRHDWTGWPLSADDWGTQTMFFLAKGFRVVAADRHDMDHYADDLRAVVEHLDLQDAIHVGHSTGGGEVTRPGGLQS